MTQSRPAPNRSILHHFSTLKDPRRPHRRLHELQDIIVIALCAVIANAQDWQQVAEFGRQRLDWFKTFLHLPNGIPSHDTFERVFDRIHPRAFQACFASWVEAVSDGVKIKHIAIDGKSLRGSGSTELGPLHLVSAWATEQNLSLGQVAVDAKSNEITAIPALLELLDIRGALVTIDAMGCQKEIAAKIVAGGGDYLLVVKGNHQTLLHDIQEVLGEALDTDEVGCDPDTYETEEKGHGRTEGRRCTVLHTTEGISQAGEWKKLTTIGMCVCERTEHGKTVSEVRYFIGSKKRSAKYYLEGLRNHWSIENCLHWQLDVTFAEDDNRYQRRHGAENLALLRRLTLSLLKAHPATLSMRMKRYVASLQTEFLEEILQADGILGKR